MTFLLGCLLMQVADELKRHDAPVASHGALGTPCAREAAGQGASERPAEWGRVFFFGYDSKIYIDYVTNL
jgi:hypothetical protein